MSDNSAWRQTNSLGRVNEGREVAGGHGPWCKYSELAQFRAFFSFLYFKKIKISKIYVCFEIFQNYPRSPYGGDRP